MNCANCGAGMEPGVQQCPFCGNQICNNNYVYGKLSLTWEEAKKGGVHTVELRNLINPIRVRIKPRTRSGDKVRVAGAMFQMEDESVMLAPVEITVHVERRPLWQPVLAILACLLLTTAAGLGVYAMVQARNEALPNTEQSSISAAATTLPTTLPTHSNQTTAPTQYTTTVTTDPSTEAGATAATDPSTEPTTEPTTEPSTAPAYTSIIPNMELRPMLQQLSPEHLEVAEALYQACMNFEPSVTLNGNITPEEMDNIRIILHYECPELMQFEIHQGGLYYMDGNGMMTSFDIPYTVTQTEYTQMYTDCMEVIERLVDETQGMTDAEKEWYVYEYITSNCTYSMDVPLAGTAYGTLVQEIAKCDGISFAMKWAMEEMGIPCIVVAGDPTVGDIGHAWNYIMLDGQYYGLDVTADVRKEGEECPLMYGAYNVSTDVVKQTYLLYDLFQNYVQTPTVTTMDMSYHAQNGDYIPAGGDWESSAKTQFLAICETGGEIRLQFESVAEMEQYNTVIYDRLNTWYHENGCTAKLSWQNWYVTELGTVCVEVTLS